MKIKIKVKSGTSNYYDYDGCDYLIKEVDFPVVPRIGEIISLYVKDTLNKVVNHEGKEFGKYVEFLVRDVVYTYTMTDECYISVYVIPITEYKVLAGRCHKNDYGKENANTTGYSLFA